MNKLFILVFATCLFTASSVFAATDFTTLNNLKLSHKWIGECKKEVCNFASSYKPPVPFNYSKTEAMLSVGAGYKMPQDGDLNKVLDYELKGIRGDLVISEYMEEDKKNVQDNIAVYQDKINGVNVGFIKYRTLGPKDGQKTPMPITIIQALVPVSGTVVIVSLTSFFGGHQEEVRADQLAIVGQLLASATQTEPTTPKKQ